MTCAELIAAATAILGFTPQPGTVVNVPQSYMERSSYAERYQAKVCARRHGIRWKVVDR